MKTMALALAAALAAVPGPLAAQARRLPLTGPERTAYEATTRYEEVMQFLREVDAASPLIHLTSFGRTMEGRALPLAVVGRVRDASPEAVRASGRLVVYIQANIHAGEVEGKEAALLLLRDFARGRNLRWLDSLVLLVAPIYNADGNERVLLTNRPLQDGPPGGMGQRPNAQGLDLNRDHIKLETAEARSQVRLLESYGPQVAFDLHTTNGTIHGYHLTYAEPLHPATDPGIIGLLRGEWLPRVSAAIRESSGWEAWYYGNTPSSPVDRGGGGPEQGWYSFDHRPRFSENYWGLRGIVGILSEAYSYATFEERIAVTRLFVEESLSFAFSNASRIRAVVAAAAARPVAGEQVAVRGALRRGGEVPVLLGEVDTLVNPYTGLPFLRRRDVRRPVTMADYTTFQGTEFVRAPRYYLVGPEARRVIERLEAHGVRLRRLAEARTVEGERFRLDSSWTQPREFQGHRERTVTGAWVAARVELPAGTVLIEVAQPLGRLAVILLEPRSDDGLLNWNFLDDWLAPGRELPVYRSDNVP
jgi:hypothetical protein